MAPLQVLQCAIVCGGPGFWCGGGVEVEGIGVERCGGLGEIFSRTGTEGCL